MTTSPATPERTTALPSRASVPAAVEASDTTNAKAPRRSNGRAFRVSAICLLMMALTVGAGVPVLDTVEDSQVIQVSKEATEEVKEELLTAWSAPSDTVAGSAGLVGDTETAEPAGETASADLVSSDLVPAATVAETEPFGIVRIERLGADWEHILFEGVTEASLNLYNLGHYKSTVMPGEDGNFAVAGHRGAGTPLTQVHTLVAGDIASVETAEGSYTYSFMRSEETTPDDKGLLYEVPTLVEGVKSDADPKQVLTLTTCGLLPNGDGDLSVRHISYFKFEGFEAR